MFHGHLDYIQKPHVGGRPSTTSKDHGNLESHNRWLIIFWWVDSAWIECIEISFGQGPNHTWLHTTLEGPWPHYVILEVSWDGGLWTLPFGLSHFHSHNSWLICEVALSSKDVKHDTLNESLHASSNLSKSFKWNSCEDILPKSPHLHKHWKHPKLWEPLSSFQTFVA